MGKSITLKKRDDGVGVVTIDVPGKSQNTLQESFTEEFRAIREEARTLDLKAIVLTTGKDNSWIAGADIELLKKLTSVKEATERSRELQLSFDEIEESTIPFVAAIHGACLGGGLELALACRARVASNDPRTKLGVPEVQIGLLPGGGGTQRLPHTVGLEKALDLALTGKQINAKRALKMGLVDEVVPRAILIDVAASIGLRLKKEGTKSISDRVSELTDVKVLRELALAKNPAGRTVVFGQAEKTVRSKAGDHYPAPYKILEVMRVGLEKGMKAGLEAEATAFGELVMTDVARRLIEIFFATTELKKDNGTRAPNVTPRKVDKVGVLGAGLMGHGIAYVSSGKADCDVRIRDRNDEAVASGIAEVRKLLDGRVEKRRMTWRERDRQMNRITGTTDYSGFKNCDVVIEAVFEDLKVKHQVLKEVEEATNEDTIFASNTSSIPISKIAEASSRPENVVGMHYFSPVEKMPLLEVIRTKKTKDEVIATVVALGRKQGKTVIVVNDRFGFYTSRVLGPYMNEAGWLLNEGVPIETIDEAAMHFGFPVGPIKLLDEVGIDIAAKVSKLSMEHFGDRLEPAGSFDKLVEDGRTGKKGKKGFYCYGQKKKGVDESVYAVIGATPKKKERYDLDEIGERLGLPIVCEAIRCLEEEVLRNPRDGDIGAIFGFGFPPFRGGPFRYADALGPAELLRRVRGLADRFGKRFDPPELLAQYANSGRRFYEQ